MGASQRTKGAGGEREAAKALAEEFGIPVKRTLGQARDSGTDIHLGRWRIEVKRRKRVANLYDWLKQAEDTCGPSQQPAVMLRADGEGWLVVMPWWVAARLMREDAAADDWK